MRKQTLLVLHGTDVANCDPFEELDIDCFDTDVFVLLLYYFDELCTRTLFNGKNGSVNTGTMKETFGKQKVRAL